MRVGTAFLVALGISMPVAAFAQPGSRPSVIGQTNVIGAAGEAARLQALGYSVHNLRVGPDGRSWMGEVTQNGLSHTITTDANGNPLVPAPR
jgi:hypothetical protein